MGGKYHKRGSERSRRALECVSVSKILIENVVLGTFSTSRVLWVKKNSNFEYITARFGAKYGDFAVSAPKIAL